MRKFDYYWMSNLEWYHRKDNLVPVINDDAPPEAQESYKRYLEQSEYAEQRVKEGKSLD